MIADHGRGLNLGARIDIGISADPHSGGFFSIGKFQVNFAR